MKEWLNPFSSFRAQLVFFVLLVLAATIIVLFFINHHSEQRITQLVAEHLKDTSLAVDLAQTSFPGNKYLYQLIPEDGRLRIGLDESHIIHRIVVADANGRIIDSSERDDIYQPIQQVLGELTPAPFAKPPRSATPDGREPEQVLTYPVETEKGRRRVVIIISPHRLSEIVREEERGRWLSMTLLGLLLIFTVAFASSRFTKPVRELTRAAERVSAGDFDFNVVINRHDEMGKLAHTFNEMLAGLRSRRELEEKLQRAERSALTGRIAAGIAHEIRNPLSFINLTVDYVRDRFAPAADGPRADYTQLLDNVKSEIARLNQMVSDFLSFGRPARLKLREIDALELLAEVAGLVRAQAAQQGVSVNVAPADENDSTNRDTRFHGDAEQLKTCFSNLAINAVQAMTEGGALKLTLRPQPSNIRFEVADTGLGIAPETLGQIFEPYFSTKETGIGLGLALTKKLIEDHGGQILVSSEVGVGTTFTVVLPRTPALSQQALALPQLMPGVS
jgi:signal transduction histidine kinase